MSEGVKRYDLGFNGIVYDFSGGRFVEYTDYALLEAERDKLLKALKKYGEHQNQCGIMRMSCPKTISAFNKCMCGLDLALGGSNE